MTQTKSIDADEQTSALLLNEAMRTALDPYTVDAGETVIRQGDVGQRFFVVESGALDIVVTSEQGIRLPVARLGPGSHFGEMSLLTGAVVSADVVASEPSVLYAANADEFDRLVRGDTRLIDYLAGTLAIRLKKANEQLAVQQQRQSTFSRLISTRSSTRFLSDLPGYSRKLKEAIQEAAQSDLPLLITGEKGVGKRALSLHIHSESSRQDQAVLVVDCQEMPSNEAHKQIFGDADPSQISRFANRLGYLQAADRGTLILARVDRLPVEVQQELAIFLQSQQASTEEWRVDIRIICTCDAQGESAKGAPLLHMALQQAFDNRIRQLLPLRQRRRDIEPLAKHFLEGIAQRAGMPVKELGESAIRELLAYDFHAANIEELRQVLNLAVDLAEEEVVNGSHLFFGAGQGMDTLQVDLLRWAWLEELLRGRRFLTGLKIMVALVFAAIVGACLVMPGALPGKIANVLVWGVWWWPALVLSAILLGRVWCAVCPLSSSAEVTQRAGGRGFAPSARLRKIGIAIALLGFIGIFWIEQMTHMTEHPRYTAILLISLAAVAVIMGWLFQRHTWCRYLCPLGAMGAVFSVGSVLRIQARREVCSGSCKGNECYKGTADAQGCPMFNHTMFLNSGQQCKLCMECLRACPSQSPRLILQPPLWDIWRSNLITAETAPMAAIIGFLALLLAATPITGLQSMTEKLYFTGGALLAVIAGLLLFMLFQAQQQRENEKGSSWIARAFYTYAPTTAALLFAFHIRQLPVLHEMSLHFTLTGRSFPAVSLLQLAQGLVIMIGGLMTLLALWQLSRNQTRPQLIVTMLTWTPLALLAVGYLVGGFILLN